MSIREECGVFGIRTRESEKLAETVYYGLYALQHRGQESCGIVTKQKKRSASLNTYISPVLTQSSREYPCMIHEYAQAGSLQRKNKNNIKYK